MLSTVTAVPSRIRSVRRGDGGEHDLGGADGEVGAVVLADADEVDAELVGELGLGDDVAEDLGVRQRAAVGVEGDVAEGVEAEFDVRHGDLTNDPAKGFPTRPSVTLRRSEGGMAEEWSAPAVASLGDRRGQRRRHEAAERLQDDVAVHLGERGFQVVADVLAINVHAEADRRAVVAHE